MTSTIYPQSIRKAREAKNLTAEELAAEANVSRSTIYKVENSGSETFELRPSVAQRLARKLSSDIFKPPD